MNDVVFVMTNSRLANRKKARKAIEYSIDDLSSDDEWIAENNGSSSNNEGFELDNLDLNVPSDDDLIEVQVVEDASGGGAPLDDLEIPNDDINEIDIDDEDEAMDNDEDHMEDDNLDDHGLNEFL